MDRNVVIVGGGYLGADLARMLDGVAQVTLVEEREAFCHSSAMIRALVQPGLAERALFPYGRMLKNGHVIRARAIAVDGGGVTLDGGERIDAGVVVVATGSRHGAPFKPAGASVRDFLEASRAAREAVAAAGSVLIVGGGAVGTELAGEIKAALPGKSVTLVSDGPLLAGYNPRLGDKLAKKLLLLGADLILDERAEGLANTVAPFAGDVTLADGRRIEADLVIPALGSRPETPLLDQLPGIRKGPDGRVLTDRWMRPSKLPNLFAAGDAADNGDPMTIIGASRQAPWLARAIRGVLDGRRLDSTPAYAPWPSPPILVPLGERLGNSLLPVVGLAGNGPTRLIKGRDLFLPKYGRLFRTSGGIGRGD